MEKSQKKVPGFKKIIPYIFVLWVLDIVIAFSLKRILTGHFSPGVHGASLLSHQVRIGIRILIAFIMSGMLFTYIKHYTSKDLLLTGSMWLLLVLLFEWGGSLLIGRSVQDILIGWNIFNGYAWPYFLLSVFLAPVLMGQAIRLYSK